MRWTRSLVGVCALAAFAGGCDTDFFSDSGRVAIDAPRFHYPAPDRWRSGLPIAVGSNVCLAYDGWYEADLTSFHDEELPATCFDVALEGVGTLDGRCVRLDAPGDATVHLSRSDGACPADLGDDTVRMEAVAITDAYTSIEFEYEQLVIESGEYDAPGVDPADLVTGPHEPLPIAAGSRISLTPGLRRIVDDERIAWTDGDIVSSTDSAELVSPGDDESDRFAVEVGLVEGQTATLAIQLGGASAQAASLEAVPVAQLSDLRIVAFGRTSDDAVLLLRALARDAQGRPVRGTPVTWTVLEGDLELEVGSVDPDYALVDEDALCVDGEAPPEQDVTVQAQLGDEVQTYTWHFVPPACDADLDGGPGSQVDEDGLGCACAAGADRGAPAWPLWTLLGVALAATRRRRRVPA